MPFGAGVADVSHENIEQRRKNDSHSCKHEQKKTRNDNFLDKLCGTWWNGRARKQPNERFPGFRLRAVLFVRSFLIADSMQCTMPTYANELLHIERPDLESRRDVFFGARNDTMSVKLYGKCTLKTINSSAK